MNKTVLIGRLTKDPEIRYTNSNIAVVKFIIAVNRQKEKDGSQKADFINCIAWRNIAENIAKYCKKGSQIALNGRLQTGNYDAPDGTKRYTTDVVVEQLIFLSYSNNEQKNDEQVPNYNYSKKPKEEEYDPFAIFNQENSDSFSSELPF